MGEKQSFKTNETFQEFIDLFAFLSLISRFPDASEDGKIKLTPVGEFCSVIFVFFMVTWIYFEFRHMQLSALRKPIFGVRGIQEMFFRLAKQIWSRA